MIKVIHKQIRNNVFESNSSSSHVISLDTSYTNLEEPDSQFPSMVFGGEFGWEFRKFNDFETKASYLWTIVCGYDFEDVKHHDYFITHYPETWNNLKGLYDNLKILESQGKLHLIEENRERGDYWYVDHGSDHWDNYVNLYPDLKTPEGIWEFLTRSSYWVFLGNDNSTSPPGFHLTPNQYSNYNWFVKVQGVESLYPLSDPTDKKELEKILNDAAYYVDQKQGYRYDREFGWMTDPSFDETHIIMPYKKYIDDEDGNFKGYETTKIEKVSYVIIGPKN